MSNRLSKRDLSRPRPTREPNKRYIIICEGSKTEVTYFKSIRNYVRNPAIDIVIRGGDRVSTDPCQMLDYATKCDNETHVWCVFDHDQRPNIDAILEKARKAHGVRQAFSNPCFELWFLLHFKYTTSQHTPKSILVELGDKIQDYDKSSDYFGTLPHYKCAYDRACKLDKYHANVGNRSDENPSTSVHILVDELMKMKM